MEPIKNNSRPFSFYTLSFPCKGLELKEGIKGVLAHVEPGHILKQTLFYPPSVDSEELLDIVREVYSGNPPATSLICQPLADGMDIGLELWCIDADVQYKNGISLLELFDSKWAFLSGIEPEPHLSFQMKCGSVLNRMHMIMNSIGFTFKHLVRTWYYIGGILQMEGDMSRYDLLNMTRNKFYDGIWDEKGQYPASTGIGMDADSIIMDGIALVPSPDTRVVRLENPLQIRASDYDIPFERRPRFCRAIFIGNGGSGVMFVSGTASIRGADVIHPDNIRDQTYVTIENIKRLISNDNLSRYDISWDITLNDIPNIRVYVKERSYYHEVKEICKEYFANIPQIYLVADICRSSLLVEIEAVVAKGSA